RPCGIELRLHLRACTRDLIRNPLAHVVRQVLGTIAGVAGTPLDVASRLASGLWRKKQRESRAQRDSHQETSGAAGMLLDDHERLVFKVFIVRHVLSSAGGE